MSKIDVDKTVEDLEDGSLPGWISDHLKTYRESGGKDGHLWDSSDVGGPGLLPTLLLITKGRRSGRLYTHPLIYGKDGDNYLIVGSKGGADSHTAWFYNLQADPNVQIQVGEETLEVQATLTTGDERSRLWTLMTEVFPNYIEYQSKTTREIPIFSLAPR